MQRLIDADAIEFPDANYWEETHEDEDYGYGMGVGDCIEIIEKMPTIDAEPVRHGKWLDDGQYDNFFPHHEWRCSECGEHVLEIGDPWFKYCPNCGARMDEE